MSRRWVARDWFLPWILSASAVAALCLRGPRIFPALACLVGLGLVPLRKGPWRFPRWLPYAMALPFMAVFAAQVATSREGRAGWEDLWILPAWYFACLSVLQAGSPVRFPRPSPAGWTACLALALSGPAVSSWPLAAALFQTIMLIFLLRAGSWSDSVRGLLWRALPVLFLAMVLFCAFWRLGAPLEALLAPHGRGGVRAHQLKGFSSVVLLGTFASEWGEGDDEVVARAFGKRPGEFLTGAVHDLYGAGSWRSKGPSLPQASPRNVGDATVFCRDGRDPGGSPSGWIQSALPTQGYLLLPASTACEAVVSDSAMRFPSGSVVAPGAQLGRGIWWYADSGRDTARNPTDLAVPHVLEGLLDSALADCSPDPRDRTDRNLPKSISAWFAHSFRFTLVPGWKAGEDPLRRFLRERKGYCEYFATASVLMLRRAGIPARYATGYAYPDRGPGGSWIYRRANAHAWVLVKDPERGWIPFDPTPPSDRPPQGVGAWTRMVQDLEGRLQSVWHSIRDGNWRTVLDRMSDRWSDDAWIPWAAGFAGLVGFGILVIRRRGRNSTSSGSAWVARLEAAESRLRREGHLREPGETVGKFLLRLPPTADPNSSQVLREYQRRRFAP